MPVRFDGPLNAGTIAPWIYHRGVGGSALSFHAAEAATMWGAGNPYTPTVFRIGLGANDAIAGSATWITDYGNYLAQLHSLVPSAVFSLGRITYQDARPATAATMNAQMVTIASNAQAAGMTVALEGDPPLVYPGDFDLASPPHPNPSGYAKIAPYAAAGITAALRAGGIIPYEPANDNGHAPLYCLPESRERRRRRRRRLAA